VDLVLVFCFSVQCSIRQLCNRHLCKRIRGEKFINGEIHTNFKLDGDGEYLALVRPDGTTVEHDYAPQFPEQKTDVSCGMSFSGNGKDLTLSPSPFTLS